MKLEYVITAKTYSIESCFDEYGNEHSMIEENSGAEFFNKKTPTDIVEYSFNSKGYGFDGAIAGARFLLNKKQNVPVLYSYYEKILLIRCKTADGKGTVFLSDLHIHTLEPLNDRQTKVIWKNGKSLIVGEKHHILENKRKDCAIIHSKVQPDFIPQGHYPAFPSYGSYPRMLFDPNHLYFTKRENDDSRDD